MPIATKLKEARQKKGLTQKQLGDKCGMYESQIRRYELGSLNPKIETLQKIADALDVPVSEVADCDFDGDSKTQKSHCNDASKKIDDAERFTYVQQVCDFLLDKNISYYDCIDILQLAQCALRMKRDRKGETCRNLKKCITSIQSAGSCTRSTMP